MTAQEIGGTCKPGFERVAEAFKANFDSKGEIGASVCLTVGGETVVDLWGGTADQKTNAPWTRDTLSIVFSCTKGATALCAHVLASQGKLDLDAPVREVWPEFAQHGKGHVTTRMMLDHSSAVPAVRAKVKDDGPLRLGLHDGAAGRRGAVLATGHAQRLSRLHLRLDGRRDGPPCLRQVARHVFS
jgi:CubicO group peptidase (beta-lactamase class C family)